MKHLLLFTFIAALAASANNTNSTCSEISRSFREFSRTKASSDFKIPGLIAENCLRSMPFDEGAATKFLKEVRKYIAFHSTLDVLKDPPKTYLSSPVDILAGLDNIARKKYNSQYEFDTDINDLISSANDSHLLLKLCSLGIFNFGREAIRITSVSQDGIELPEIYALQDLELLMSNNNNVSPIVAIDSKKPTEFLYIIAKTVLLQDPDAQYNSLFGSKMTPGNFAGNQGLWPGSDITSIQFKNDSTRHFNTIAFLTGKDFNANNGQELFMAECVPKSPSSKGASNSSDSPVPTGEPSGPAGYPPTNFHDPFNQIGGYYLDEETAVLLVKTFEGSEALPRNQSKVFADVATQFISDAVATGHSKLIIDMSGNPGGVITRAFDLFKLFFPDKLPYSATRFRRDTAAELLASIFATSDKTVPKALVPFAFAEQVTPDQTAGFQSVESFLGNTTELGSRVSSLFANFNYTSTSTEILPIRGFGSVPIGNNTAPFKPENIIIIGDGVCISACTAFTNLMVNAGGVRTVVFGGRPKEEPMQVMGGVRGSQVASFGLLDQWVTNGTKILKTAPNGTFSKSFAQNAKANLPIGVNNLPLVLTFGAVNLRNAYQESNDDLPLQFDYQAANCRLFFTADNYISPATTWKAAKEAIWGSKGCVKGSTTSRVPKGRNSTGSGGRGDLDSDGLRSDTSPGATLAVTRTLLIICLIPLINL